jgi:hypothetical protein
MKNLYLLLLFPSLLFSQWVHQITPTDVDMLLSIDFANSNTGVAGGWVWEFRGKAVYTTNSGNTWLLAQVPDSSRSFVKAQMIDANVGYIAGAYNSYPLNEYKVKQYEKEIQIIHQDSYLRDYYNRIGFTGELESYKGLFLKTTNGGQSWNTYGNLPANVFYLLGMRFINAMTGFVSSSFHYGGAESEGILKTTNGGISWNTLVTVDSVALYNISTIDGNSIYVAGWARGSSWLYNYGIILWSTNGGINWNRHNIPYAAYFHDIYFSNQTTGFAVGGTEGEGLISTDSIPKGVIYKTTNSGLSWFKLPDQLDSTYYYAVGLMNGTGIAIGEKKSQNIWHMLITRTINFGITWTHHVGTDNNVLYGLSMPTQNIWFVSGGMENKLIYKTTNGGAIAIEPISEQVPVNFSLSQNYPNPFNPSTKIRFSVTSGKFDIPPLLSREGTGVSLKIFDILGREITTLINEQLKPGTYEVEWDARLGGSSSELSSGMYFYKLIAGDFIETKKMILLK